MEDAYSVKMASMTDDWYPDFWVAFLCMGRPAGEDKVSSIFHSGFPTRSFSQLPPHDAVLAAAMRGGVTTGLL